MEMASTRDNLEGNPLDEYTLDFQDAYQEGWDRGQRDVWETLRRLVEDQLAKFEAEEARVKM